MRMAEVLTYFGKTVSVSSAGDLYMCYELRPVICKNVTLIRQARSGMMEVELEGKKYYVPPRNIRPPIDS